MIRVNVLYPNTEGSNFDWDYYLDKHIPLVEKLLKPQGLVEIGIEKGVASADPGQPPEYQCIFSMTFKTMEEFQKAFETSAQDLMADIPNYTDAQPLIQISEIIR